MKKFVLVVAALLSTSAFAPTCSAGIIFDDSVNFLFSNATFGPAIAPSRDIYGVTAVNFGSQNGDFGRIAANGTDTNLSGVLDAGDKTNIVGHAIVDQVTNAGGDIRPLDGAVSPRFSLTAVLRNVTGEITSLTGAPGPVFGNRNEFDGGFIDLYLDIDPQTGDPQSPSDTIGFFDPDDLATTVDDERIATFAVYGGEVSFLGGGLASTIVLADLIYNPYDIIALDGGLDPLDPLSQLKVRLQTTDLALPPGTPFANIDNGTGMTNIGPGFDTTAPGFFDSISAIDGNARFAVVPEPGSMAAFAMIGLLGVGYRRRRS